MTLEISPVSTMRGSIRPPGDKSLTHRAYLLGAIAKGPSTVERPLEGEDCQATLRCLTQLGLRHERMGSERIKLLPAAEWQSPSSVLDCGNSGTTIRLLSGLVASRPIQCSLAGDASLNRRPMRRIAEPLRLMGAEFHGDTPPLRIHGSSLHGIDYQSPVASAQVKSCILLAGLRADGVTSVREPSQSRDHTERMLRATGVEITTNGAVSVRGGQKPQGFYFAVPGDISSAAFFMVAAAILPNAEIELCGVSVNPSRTGIFDVFDQANVAYRAEAEKESLGEPVAAIHVRRGDCLRPFRVEGALVPRLIDELPVLAVLATQCEGTSVVRDATEMRVKESDRIEMVAAGLRAMGARIEVFPDGFAITGPTRLRAARIDARGDHRIAMAFAIAGLVADGNTVIDGAETITTSYPQFEEHLMSLCII